MIEIAVGLAKLRCPIRQREVIRAEPVTTKAQQGDWENGEDGVEDFHRRLSGGGLLPGLHFLSEIQFGAMEKDADV